MSSAVTGYKRAFGADVVPCTMMWKTAIWWCWSARTPLGASGAVPAAGAGEADNPRLRIVAIDPGAPPPAIADRHLALAPEATAGCLRGCLTPG